MAKSTLKKFLAGKLPEFEGGFIPGAKGLGSVTGDFDLDTIHVEDGESWFIDVLEDGTAITYNPWV